jgi:U3 small nucleolar RNA-associated protein 19
MTAMLALDGLFLLMTQHGLEYTHFYTSLYKLLKPSLFYHKHRIRFLELLTKSLTRNPLLPCHVVAAFMKRLLRISLVCPPAACLTTLALVSNLLRLHPECASLVHCNNNDDNMMMQDRFNADTDDPTQARALESSLWELHVLEQHYYPAVATLAHSMGRDEQGPLHNIEDDFVRLSYKSLLDQERKRLEKKRKKVPLTFSKPKGLFVETSVLDGIFNVPVAGYTNEK